MTDETIEICPNPDCGSPQIRNRVPRGYVSDTDDGPEYRCSKCGEKFDDPDTRERRSTAGPGVGSPEASKLARMDPDDVPALGGDEDAA